MLFAELQLQKLYHILDRIAHRKGFNTMNDFTLILVLELGHAHVLQQEEPSQQALPGKHAEQNNLRLLLPLH